MSIQTYEFQDNATGNIFQYRGNKAPDFNAMDRIVRTRTRMAQTNLATKNYYKHERGAGGEKLRKLPAEERARKIEYDTALALGVSVDDVDATSGVMDFQMKSELDLRRDPREKLDFLRSQYGKDAVRTMMVGGKPRFILDTNNQNGQPKYIFMDEEGFTLSDFGDISGDWRRVATQILALPLIVGGVALTGTGIGSPVGLTLTALGLALTDYGTKTLQDLAVGAYDRSYQEEMGIEKTPLSQYMGESLKQTAVESTGQFVIDRALFGAGRWLSSVKGVGPDNFAKKMIADMEMLNQNFGKEVGAIKLSSGAMRSRAGAQADIDATLYSKTLRDMMEQNRVAIEGIMNSMKTGNGGSLKEAIDFTNNAIRQNYQNMIKVLGQGDEAITLELNKAMNRTLKRNGIDGKFDSVVGGRQVQLIEYNSFNRVKNVKDRRYNDVYAVSNQEGVRYNANAVFKAYQETLKEITGGVSNKEQKAILKALNASTGNQFKTLKELEKFVSKQIKVTPVGVQNLPKLQKALLPKSLQAKQTVTTQKPVELTMRQLDNIIRKYADDANYGAKSMDKSQLQIFAEKFSNRLRTIRNNGVIDPKTGKALKQFEGTGNALLKANDYYNAKYLPFFNLVDGNIIKMGKGGNYTGEFAMGGDQALNRILANASDVEGYLKLITNKADREKSRNILRQAYQQNIGANGIIDISKGTQLKYDINVIRALYGELDSAGNVLRNAQTDKLMTAKARALDSFNELASQNPRSVLNLGEDKLAQLLNASTPKQVQTLEKIIKSQVQLDMRLKAQTADAIVGRIIKDPDFTMHPEMFADYLLEASPDMIKKFNKYMDELASKPNGAEIVDGVRTAIIERLEYMSRKGLSSAEKGMDDTIFNPESMIGLLREGNIIGKNAEALLGKETVSNIRASANILKFSTERPVKDAGARVVAGSNLFTAVFPDVLPAVQNKLYGRFATTPVLKDLFAMNIKKYQKPEIIADRFAKTFPYLIASKEGFGSLLKSSTMNAEMLYFLQQEATAMSNQAREDLQQRVALMKENQMKQQQNVPTASGF
jgi:hypothetical protein